MARGGRRAVETAETEERYGIAELANAAGVSVRTVRYYIAEGLLPPPVAAGAKSSYTREHLDRLRVIGRLKDAFLPLKEIRRQLAAMDDAAIRELAAEAGPDAAHELAAPAAPWEASMAEAAGTPERGGPSPSAAPAAARAHRRIEEGDSAASYVRRLLTASHPPAPLPRPVPPPRPPHHPPAAGEASWRRIRLGDDAELLIREETYQRRRDKIDWLIDWARKVLG